MIHMCHLTANRSCRHAPWSKRYGSVARPGNGRRVNGYRL